MVLFDDGEYSVISGDYAGDAGKTARGLLAKDGMAAMGKERRSPPRFSFLPISDREVCRYRSVSVQPRHGRDNNT